MLTVRGRGGDVGSDGGDAGSEVVDAVADGVVVEVADSEVEDVVTTGVDRLADAAVGGDAPDVAGARVGPATGSAARSVA